MGKRKIAATLTVAATLGGAGTALAARPKPGRIYAGVTSARAINGFHPVVSFTVSKNGKQLLHFLYESMGCFGSGGVRPGTDPFLQASDEYKLGSIPVKPTGIFSLKNHKTTFSGKGFKYVTTSTISGHFKNRNTAVGEITFTQKYTAPGSPSSSCNSLPVKFTATLRP